jgi:hypothetical protein
VRVFQLVLHLLHLPRLLLQRLLILYQLLVDLRPRLPRQHVLQLQKQLLLLANQVLLRLHLLRLSYQPSIIDIKNTSAASVS